MLDFLVRAQSAIQAALTGNLSAFAASHDSGALAAVLPLGVIFGAVHAWMPGHSKSVLASYVLGSG
ncbi:hypothetical protein, partial [Escherichia coli]|uniref:hypothetical protein n=1 Tax=Escherichia coli TaxID=562 RepID=UPI0019548354